MGKDKFSKTSLILYASGIIPVVWLALLVAPAFAGGLGNLLKNLSTVFNNPFHIEFCEDSLKTVLTKLNMEGILKDCRKVHQKICKTPCECRCDKKRYPYDGKQSCSIQDEICF